jgi:DNA-binding GntR family transcriptional regulator
VAYAHLKKGIINLDFSSGEWLKGQEVAQHLSLSRTPVREALARLEQEGLVQRASGWGYVVRGISVKEVADLFKIRESLELLVALECMAVADGAALKDLERTLDEASACLKAGEAMRVRELNREFQFKLARATGNTLLQQLLLTLHDRIWWVGSLHYRVRPERVAESLKENRRIFAAIRKGKAVDVRKAVLAHIRNSRTSLSRYAAGFLLNG